MEDKSGTVCLPPGFAPESAGIAPRRGFFGFANDMIPVYKRI